MRQLRIVRAGQSADALAATSGVSGPSAADAPQQESAELSDAELIAAVRRGDHRASSAIYERLNAPIERAILRVFRRREVDHDDLIQAAFEQVIKTLLRERFDGRCSLRAWAATLAANHALNALTARRAQRRLLSPEIPRETGSGDTEQRYAARDEIDRVRNHLADMERDKALTVFLYEVMGHDLSEIANLMGVTVAAAQSRLVRGRRELLQRLNDPAGQRS